MLFITISSISFVFGINEKYNFSLILNIFIFSFFDTLINLFLNSLDCCHSLSFIETQNGVSEYSTQKVVFNSKLTQLLPIFKYLVYPYLCGVAFSPHLEYYMTATFWYFILFIYFFYNILYCICYFI